MANCTWAKAIGVAANNDSGLRENAYAYWSLNRAVQNYDRTQNLQLQGMWELPFGRGKAWRRDGRRTQRGACVLHPERYTRTQVSLRREAMCDYSLAGLPNRLAVDGDQLVVHRFSTGAIGLAPLCPSLKQLIFRSSAPAVCVPPGARLRLRDIPGYLQCRLQVGTVEEVTFVEQSAEAFTYRDAVRFSNGREILLQHLRRGQRVDVLSLSGVEEEAEHQRREEEYRRVFVG